MRPGKASSGADHQIQRSLRQVMAGRTAIVIAHRLNTIQDVDWILVLHHGQVVERGTHAELLAQQGVYFRLYELQYRTQEPAGQAASGTAAGASRPLQGLGPA